MLTDTHCHLISHRYPAAEIPALVDRSREAGVTRIVSLATSLDDFEANLRLAADHPAHVRVGLGIHPCNVHEEPDDAPAKIEAHFGNPGLCVIGETGLDYYHPAPAGWDEAAYHQRQRDFLDAQFALAAKAGLNIVIHTRDRSGDASFRDALDLYRAHASKVRAVFHCFVGSEESAREVLALGGLVSFGGVATFKNGRSVLEVATRLPTEGFMLETDAPYLAPDPFRGQRNEPAHTRLVAEKIAASRGVPLDRLAAETEATASAFFSGLP